MQLRLVLRSCLIKHLRLLPYQKWTCLAPAAAIWLLFASVSWAQTSSSSSQLVGLALTGNATSFIPQVNSMETNTIYTPSAGGPGSTGLNAGQHADPEPPSGFYGLLWTLYAQIDNSAGTSAVTVPSGNLTVIDMPLNWHASLSPTSAAYTVPAHSTGQMKIGGFTVAQGLPSMPSDFGVGQITLASGQTARMQLTLLGVIVPVSSRLNPSYMLNFRGDAVGGIVQ